MATRIINGEDIVTLTYYEGTFGDNGSKVEVLLNNGIIVKFKPEYYESYSTCLMDVEIIAPSVWTK